MKIFDLFDKKEQRQIDILLLTLKNHREITITELANELYTTKEIIREDILRIQGTMKPIADRFSVRCEDDRLTIITEDVSSVELYYQFLSETIAYEILMELYRTNKLQKQAFAIRRSISLATLTRRIRQLNTLLEPFDLQIRNGQLQGCELQIRHFYFSLFWNGIPYERVKEKVYTPDRAAFIQNLAEELEISIEEWAQVRIALWMSISRKRMSLEQPAQPIPSEYLKKFYVSEELLTILHEDLAKYNSRYAYEISLEESRFFYLFLIASFSIPLTSLWWRKMFEGSAAKQDIIFQLNQHSIQFLRNDFSINEIKQDFIEDFLPILYQIHAQFLWFRGHIDHINDQRNHHLEETFFEMRLTILRDLLVVETRTLLLENGIQENYDWEKLAEQYHLLLYETHRNMMVELRIAFDFPDDRSFTAIMKEKIISQIDTRVAFKVVELDGKAHPDIIITRLRRKQYLIPKDRVCVVLDVEYDYDMEHVLTFISDAYKEKVKNKVMK